MDESDAAGWVIRTLGSKYENGLVFTAERLRFDLTSIKMDEVTIIAMWDEANINSLSQRTIMWYLRGEFEKKCVIPTIELAKLQKILVTIRFQNLFTIIQKLMVNQLTFGTNLSYLLLTHPSHLVYTAMIQLMSKMND